MRSSILEELDFLWENYALAPDEDLAPDALKVKEALNNRFKADRWLARDRRDIETALLKKGFKEGEGDHQYYIYWNLKGKKP